MTIAAAAGAAMFRFRYHLRFIRWGGVCCLIGLHMVMKKPVWHLICRINAVGGSSSWHRYLLVDGAITHFHEWWLMGSRVGTAHWGHYAFDVTNCYIVQGISGGVLQLGLFVAVIAVAFGMVGRMWRVAGPDRSGLIFAWGWVSLFVQAVNHFGVTYFGQVWMGWYLLLAMIEGLAQ